LAAIGLSLSALLFRSPLAAALVTRGDDAWHAGDLAAAVRAYRKARFIDPGSLVAVDRLAFQLALRHDRRSAAEALALAEAALVRAPNDVMLLADRRLAALQLHRAARSRTGAW
jgi:hypothetical protein